MSLHTLVNTLTDLGTAYDNFQFSYCEEQQLIITGSGFNGQSRSDLRQLLNLLGVTYSGDLIKSWTTHLVVADDSASGLNSAKVTKAREWQIPIVALKWLLDSVDAGEPLDIEPYTIPNPDEEEEAEKQNSQKQLTEAGKSPPMQQQNDENNAANRQPTLKRPSSVASSAPPPLPPPTAAINAPVVDLHSMGKPGNIDNVAGLLRRMSISPSPLLHRGNNAQEQAVSPMFVDSPFTTAGLRLGNCSSLGNSGEEEVVTLGTASKDDTVLQSEGSSPMSESERASSQDSPATPGMLEEHNDEVDVSAAFPSHETSEEPLPSQIPPSPMMISPEISLKVYSQIQQQPHHLENEVDEYQQQYNEETNDWREEETEEVTATPRRVIAASQPKLLPVICPTPSVVREWTDDDDDDIDIGHQTVDNNRSSPPDTVPVRNNKQHRVVEVSVPQPETNTPLAYEPSMGSDTATQPHADDADDATPERLTPADISHRQQRCVVEEEPTPKILPVVAQATEEQHVEVEADPESPWMDDRPLAADSPGALQLTAAYTQQQQQPAQQDDFLENNGDDVVYNNSPQPPPSPKEKFMLVKPELYKLEKPVVEQQLKKPAATAGTSKKASVVAWSDDDDIDLPSPSTAMSPPKKGVVLTKVTMDIPTGLTQIANPIIAKAHGRPATSAAAFGQEEGGFVIGKCLLRPPRGTTVKEKHGLANLKSVKFAEQVSITDLGLTLSTKDKKAAIRIPPPENYSEPSANENDDSKNNDKSLQGIVEGLKFDSKKEPWLGEVQTLYKLPDGSWNVEYCRYYSGAQAERCAILSGQTVVLPFGFNRSGELLKGSVREHCKLSDVFGSLVVRKVRKDSAVLQLRGASGRGSHFWRSGVDPEKWTVLTDRPVTDFVLSQ